MDLKFLLQLDIPKPADVVVFECRVVVRVPEEQAEHLGWVLAEDIVTPDRYRAVVQYRLPAGHRIRGSTLDLLAILSGHHFFAAFGITGHRLLLNRRREDQTVRCLGVNE